MQIVKWGLPYYKKRMPVQLVCQLMGGIAMFIAMLLPLLTQLVFDGVINYKEGGEVTVNFIFAWLLNGSFGEKGSFTLFLNIALIFMLLVIVRDVLLQIRNNVFRINAIKFEDELRIVSYKKLLQMSDSSLAKYNTGDILTTLESDIISVKELFSTTVISIMDVVFLIVVACVFLVSYRLELILIPLGVMPVLIFVLTKYMKASRSVSSEIREKNADMNLFVQENVNGIRLVKSFVNEDFERECFDEKNTACKKGFLRQVDTQARYNLIFNSLGQLTYILTIGIGGYFALRGDIQIGVLLACSGYVGNIMSYITNLNSCIYTAQQQSVSGDRLIKFMNEQDAESGEKTEIVNYDINVKDLSLELDGKRILDDINLYIPYGKKLGIMGGTGSGKSALLKTLSDIIPKYTGEITLSGKNIKNFDIEELRGVFSYVFQDVFLFSDTIDANIAFSKPNATFNEILEAAKFAKAHGFISDMPSGYQTIVGEKGLGLSGGQKQRISVARALIKNAPILVLDDATSALDKTTERELLDTIKDKYPQKTLIISAHKVSSVADCDEIIYLSNGKIAERGTIGELIAKNGLFKKIYDLQSDRTDTDDAIENAQSEKEEA